MDLHDVLMYDTIELMNERQKIGLKEYTHKPSGNT